MPQRFALDLGVPFFVRGIAVEVVMDPPQGTALLRGFAPDAGSAEIAVKGSSQKVILPFASGLVDVELISATSIKMRVIGVARAG